VLKLLIYFLHQRPSHGIKYCVVIYAINNIGKAIVDNNNIITDKPTSALDARRRAINMFSII
tara:strand:+ start:895 stop:1080 length:186 start_codon:yes stop_codon:yes gene_type:complete